MFKKGNIIEVLILILSVVFFKLFDESSLFIGKILFVASILSNLQLLYKYRKIDIFVIFLLFSLMHIVYIVAYYYYDIPYHYITKLQTLYNTNNLFLIQLIVLRLIFIGINPKTYKIPKLQLIKRNNDFVFWLLIFILMILIPVSNMGLTSISASSGNYSIETKSSIWFEYSIVFVITASLYVKNKIQKNTLIIVSIIFMLMPLMYGKRLAFLMMALTVFNLYYSGKFKTFYIFFTFIFGFVLLRIFAQLRTTGVENINTLSLLLGITDDGIMSNGPGGVLVASVTYFDLVKQGVFDMWFSIKSFMGMFTGVFLPASLNIKETYINLESLKYENIPGNGGFPGVYFYIWGRYLGVFIGGIFLNKIIKKSQYSINYAIYTLFLLSTFPRWYTYNMHVLVKMGAWLFIFVWGTRLLKKHRYKIYN